VPECGEDFAQDADAAEGGGDRILLEGVGGCSVSPSLLAFDSLNSATADSSVGVTMFRYMLCSSPSSEETGER